MFDKYGNDLDYWYYCPVCGGCKLPSFKVCPKHKKTMLMKSKYKNEYYINKDPIKPYDILFREEISQNSLFQSEEYEKRVEKENRGKQILNTKTIYDTKPDNVPKCPTCQSTNITKISATSRALHGVAFGLFSKTARSQFECKDCGYKW